MMVMTIIMKAAMTAMYRDDENGDNDDAMDMVAMTISQ